MEPINRRTALSRAAALLGVPSFLPLLAAADPKPKVDPYVDAKFVEGPPPLPASGGFTVVLLPDTQHYLAGNPDGFLTQTRWIVEQKKARNIAAVLHLGDITNNNRPDQWALAVKALRHLDGHVPYFLSLGNHDYSDGGKCQDRKTAFNEHFPVSRYKGAPSFGGRRTVGDRTMPRAVE